MRKTLTVIGVVVPAAAVILAVYVLALSQQPREVTLEDAAEIAPAAKGVSLTAESVSNGVLLRWKDIGGVSVGYYDVYRPANGGRSSLAGFPRFKSGSSNA